MLTSLLPFVLIFVIMYFLILRPQQKRVKQHAEMVKNVRKGDTVITSGGLVGGSPRWSTTTRSRSSSPRACGCGRCGQMVTDVRAKGEPVKDDETQELIAGGAVSERQAHALFLAVEGDGDAADGVARLPVRRAEFLARKDACSRWPKWAQRHIVLGLDLQGGSHILLEVDINDVRKQKAESLRDDVRNVAARRARRLHRAGDPRSDGRGSHPRGERFPGGADQAARTVAAARRPPERDRAALGRRGRRRQPRDPADRSRSPPSPSACGRWSSRRSRSSSAASTRSARSSR